MFLIVFIFILILISIVGGLIYLFYLPINKWLLKTGKITTQKSVQINKIFITLLILTALYFTYSAFYPNESFYVDEFKEVTNLEIPQSANFIHKTASYPDFHGDYFSCSEIKVSKDDYKNLLFQVEKDTSLIKIDISQIAGSEESDIIMNNKVKSQIMFGFNKVNTHDDTYYIGFKNDFQTIFIYIANI